MRDCCTAPAGLGLGPGWARWSRATRTTPCRMRHRLPRCSLGATACPAAPWALQAGGSARDGVRHADAAAHATRVPQHDCVREQVSAGRPAGRRQAGAGNCMHAAAAAQGTGSTGTSTKSCQPWPPQPGRRPHAGCQQLGTAARGGGACGCALGASHRGLHEQCCRVHGLRLRGAGATSTAGARATAAAATPWCRARRRWWCTTCRRRSGLSPWRWVAGSSRGKVLRGRRAPVLTWR